MSSGGRVVVVGGGLAGISAAVRLAERGHGVTVLETRPRLGGATYSFDRAGLTVDTGQHVFLRAYRRYRELLERLGVAHLAPTQERLDIPVLMPGRPPVRLRRAGHGPAPLHLARALAGYRALSPAERLRAAVGANALRGVDPDDPDNDDDTFGDWLHRNGQGPRAVSRLWGLLTIAALNIDPAEASLALAARVFRDGLLDDVTAGDLGVSTVPLAALHDEPACRLFGRMGVRLHTGDRVRAVSEAPGGLVVRTDTAEVEADDVVLAVPHQAAGRLAPDGACPGSRKWEALGASPIVNVHVHYDRPVTDLGLAAVLDSRGPDSVGLGSGGLDTDAHWVFDRTQAAGADGGQYLVVSLSAADAQVLLPAEEVRRTYLTALARAFPGARQARVLDAFVTREPRATFRQQAGSARCRPPARTRWPRLVLAGAWTATGWPDTMEGAVRSGLTAADALASPDPADRSSREMIA